MEYLKFESTFFMDPSLPKIVKGRTYASYSQAHGSIQGRYKFRYF